MSPQQKVQSPPPRPSPPRRLFEGGFWADGLPDGSAGPIHGEVRASRPPMTRGRSLTWNRDRPPAARSSRCLEAATPGAEVRSVARRTHSEPPQPRIADVFDDPFEPPPEERPWTPPTPQVRCAAGVTPSPPTSQAMYGDGLSAEKVARSLPWTSLPNVVPTSSSNSSKQLPAARFVRGRDRSRGSFAPPGSPSAPGCAPLLVRSSSRGIAAPRARSVLGADRGPAADRGLGGAASFLEGPPGRCQSEPPAPQRVAEVFDDPFEPPPQEAWLVAPPTLPLPNVHSSLRLVAEREVVSLVPSSQPTAHHPVHSNSQCMAAHYGSALPPTVSPVVACVAQSPEVPFPWGGRAPQQLDASTVDALKDSHTSTAAGFAGGSSAPWWLQQAFDVGLFGRGPPGQAWSGCGRLATGSPGFGSVRARSSERELPLGGAACWPPGFAAGRHYYGGGERREARDRAASEPPACALDDPFEPPPQVWCHV